MEVISLAGEPPEAAAEQQQQQQPQQGDAGAEAEADGAGGKRKGRASKRRKVRATRLVTRHPDSMPSTCTNRENVDCQRKMAAKFAPSLPGPDRSVLLFHGPPFPFWPQTTAAGGSAAGAGPSNAAAAAAASAAAAATAAAAAAAAATAAIGCCPPAAGGPGATLIVCPVSVLSNWATQLEEHTAGNLKVGRRAKRRHAVLLTPAMHWQPLIR